MPPSAEGKHSYHSHQGWRNDLQISHWQVRSARLNLITALKAKIATPGHDQVEPAKPFRSWPAREKPLFLALLLSILNEDLLQLASQLHRNTRDSRRNRKGTDLDRA